MITMTPTTAQLPLDTSVWQETGHPTTQNDRTPIRDALRSEWIKLSSLRLAKVILALAVVIDGTASFATAKLVTDKVLTVSQVFVYPAVFTAVFAAVAGILLFTAESHHGTLALTLTAQPNRWVVAGAKALVATSTGIALGIVGMAAAAAGSALGSLALGDVSDMAVTAMYALLYTGGAAIFGLGIGMAVRHSAGAISGLLVWWFVAENLLRTFVPPTVGRFLPFDAGYRTLAVGSKFDTPEIIAAALRRPQYALVFIAWTLAALTAGTFLLHRRDAT